MAALGIDCSRFCSNPVIQELVSYLPGPTLNLLQKRYKELKDIDVFELNERIKSVADLTFKNASKIFFKFRCEKKSKKFESAIVDGNVLLAVEEYSSQHPEKSNGYFDALRALKGTLQGEKSLIQFIFEYYRALFPFDCDITIDRSTRRTNYYEFKELRDDNKKRGEKELQISIICLSVICGAELLKDGLFG